MPLWLDEMYKDSSICWRLLWFIDTIVDDSTVDNNNLLKYVDDEFIWIFQDNSLIYI
jgi:hypothetical protein